MRKSEIARALCRGGDAELRPVGRPRRLQRNRPARPQTCDEIPNRRLSICNVMKHSACSHEIEVAMIHRTSNNITLAQLKIRGADVD